MENKYYIYIYLDPRKIGNYEYEKFKFYYEPFYVGKGCKKRYLTHLKTKIRWCNYHLRNRIISIRKENKEPLVIIVKNNISNKEACILEKNFIKYFGRRDLNNGILVNMTEGGDGSGRRVTKKITIQKMKNKHWSKRKPEEFKKHINNMQKMFNFSMHKLDCTCCACKAKRGEYKGRKTYIRTKETKEKTKKSLLGHKQSLETREKRRISYNKNKIEIVRRMREKRWGIPKGESSNERV